MREMHCLHKLLLEVWIDRYLNEIDLPCHLLSLGTLVKIKKCYSCTITCGISNCIDIVNITIRKHPHDHCRFLVDITSKSPGKYYLINPLDIKFMHQEFSTCIKR